MHDTGDFDTSPDSTIIDHLISHCQASKPGADLVSWAPQVWEPGDDRIPAVDSIDKTISRLQIVSRDVQPDGAEIRLGLGCDSEQAHEALCFCR